MKYIFLIFCTTTLLLSCMPKDLPTVSEVTDTSALLKLSHMSLKSEMDTFANLCLRYQITVDYTGSTYFEDGKLRTLRLGILLPDGKSGRTQCDLTKLQYSYYGFKYDKNSQVPLVIGAIQ